VVRAEEADAWSRRWEAARSDLVEGRFDRAERAFRALAVEADTAARRERADAMARLAAEYSARATASPVASASATRTTEELTLLYASAFLYGAGTGTWFLLQVKPDSAITATIPFAALTALPVVAVATVDGVKKLPRGLPHAIAAGLYLGLGEGVWLTGYQHARGNRTADTFPGSTVRWSSETTATVLWGSATTGAVLGGLLGASLVTTPGRVSFTASTTMWAGAISGLAAGALLPDDERRAERAFLVGGAGYNAGLAGGLLFAGTVSPSVARVRLVDLVAAGTAITSGGLYLALASDVDVRAAEGVGALGAATGLGVGWLVTSGMAKEAPAPAGVATIDAAPSVSFVRGGGTLGLRGTF
jgi:hypothetical protein